MLHPCCPERRTWDMMLTAALLYTLIVVPYRAAFAEFDDSDSVL